MEQTQAADPNAPLSDDYLKAHGNDPDVVPYLTSAERRRLSKLTGEPRMGPAPPDTPSGEGISGFLRKAFPPDKPRQDDTVLGLPPELAAIGGLRVAGAVAEPALSMTGRAIAGAKAAAGEALPVVKYEAARRALHSMGVPDGLATPVAMIISGYKKGAKAEPTVTAEAPAKAPSVATESPLDFSRRMKAEYRAQSAPAPEAAPESTPSPAPAPTRTPASAPRARATASAGTTPSAASAGQLDLTPEEIRMAHKWAEQGIDVNVIAKRIVLSRQLTGTLKTPTPDEVRRAVDSRNATGKWED